MFSSSSLHSSCRHFLIASALISMILLQGCNGGGKDAVPQFTADPAAFEYAVKKTVELQIFVRECQKANEDIKNKAMAAQTAWAQRNWPQAEAADRHYSQALESSSLIYNGEKISLAAVRIYAEAEKAIMIKIDPSRHSHKNIEDTCTNKMSAYEAGTLDLIENKNADLYLKSLASPTPGEMYKLPRLAGSLKTSPIPGRSQYNLEETITADCKDAHILTLRNEWPYESYGAFCADGKSIFVSCEWGECSVQR